MMLLCYTMCYTCAHIGSVTLQWQADAHAAVRAAAAGVAYAPRQCVCPAVCAVLTCTPSPFANPSRHPLFFTQVLPTPLVCCHKYTTMPAEHEGQGRTARVSP